MHDRYVVGADEDFAPYALSARNGTDIVASQGSDTPQLQGDTVTADVPLDHGDLCAVAPRTGAGGAVRRLR